MKKIILFLTTITLFMLVSCPTPGTVDITGETELSAPSALLISANGNESFILEWTFSSVEDIDGFYLQRSTSEAFSSPASIEITDTNARTYSDTDLPTGEYYYRIQAFKVQDDSSIKKSSWSNTVNGEIELSAPSELLISADGNESYLLEWTYSSVEDIDGFYLQRSASEVFSSPASIEITDANARTYSDTGLLIGEYYYRIQAYKVQEDSSIKKSSWSNTARGEITATPQPPTAPELTGCTAVGIYDIEVTWNDNSSNENGFNIQYVKEDEYNSNGFNGSPSSESAGTNETTRTFAAIETNATWYVRIAAYNDVGSSDWSAPMSVELTSVPADPANVTATAASSTSIAISWDYNSFIEDEFLVQYDTESDFSSGNASLSVNRINRTYTLTGLASNDTYYIRIAASNSLNASSWVEADNSVDLLEVPAAPNLLSCVPDGSTGINVQWSDESDNESGFIVEFDTVNTFDSINIRTSSFAAGTTEAAVGTGFISDQKWYIRAAATNAAGRAYSATILSVDLRTVPGVPTITTCEPDGSDTISLAWTESISGNAEEFIIEYATSEPVNISSPNYHRDEGITATSASLSGLPTDTIWYIKITAKNYAGEASATDSVELSSAVPPPNPPSGLTAERVEEYTDTYIAGEAVSILLKWTDSSNETEYILQRSTSSGFSSYTSFTLPEDTDIFIDTSTAGSTQYFYRLYASNGSSLSAPLTTTGVTTDADSGQKVLHIYRKGQNNGSGPGGHIVYNIWISNGTEYQSVFKSENYGTVLNYWKNSILAYFNNIVGNTDQIDATTGPTESGRFGHTTAEDYTHSLILDGSMGTEFDVYFETDRSWEHNDWFESKEGPSLIYKAHIDLNSYSEPVIFDFIGFYDSSQPDNINYETRYITHHDADGTHEFGDGNVHTFGNYDVDNPAILFVYPYADNNDANYATGDKYLMAAIHQ